MKLLSLLGQPWPVFLLDFLLPQRELNITRGMVGLALLHIDLAVKI